MIQWRLKNKFCRGELWDLAAGEGQEFPQTAGGRHHALGHRAHYLWKPPHDCFHFFTNGKQGHQLKEEGKVLGA